jgi:hypothetical protein
MCIMAFNTWMTMRGTKSVDQPIPALKHRDHAAVAQAPVAVTA